MGKDLIKTSLAILSAVILTTGCTEKTDHNVAETSENIVSSADTALLDTVLAADIRLGDHPRDAYRHPKEVVEFFGIAPNHTVIEYAPGGGWYTRILAPYLTEKGSYIGVGFPPEAGISIGEEFVERVRIGGETFSATQAKSLSIEPDKIPFYFSNIIPEELNETVDRVVIFRMMHNLKRWGINDAEIAALKATLKPDGMIGIVQHQAKDNAPPDYVDGSKGYLKRDDVIAFMNAQGFELAATSDVNENPKDSADYPDGVWTLPPSLGSDDADKSKFEAIGESNRMTLLFKQKAS